ncbi:MAG: GHKL domain-containing protein [Roseivirga sp.]|nr:GHKL domain-containing protein [Roseivirga sp.]
MNFRDFRYLIVVRLLMITAGLFGLIYYSYIELNYIRIFFIGLFIFFVVLELFYFINRSNKDTSNFLQAIIHNDFTIKYSSERKGKSFKQLYNTFNLVNKKFIAVSQREAGEFHYLTTLIQQLGVGIISFDTKGRVHLVNDSLKELLGKKELINLRSIRNISPELHDSLELLKGGESKVLKVSLVGKLYQLSINVSEFKLRQQDFKLVSIQDIKGELDENEMTAWQKLIRVLTHEIMNSVAPITSLSGTLNMMVGQSQTSGVPLTDQQLSSLHDGLDAIEHRSDGLMNFTEAYRSLTRVPLPNIKPVEGKLYFQRIISLFTPTLAGTQIRFDSQLPKGDFTLQIDPDLMEQVFINLLKNAKEAVSATEGHITLKVSQKVNGNGKAPSNIHNSASTGASAQVFNISIQDNGRGIPDEVADKIFIPFYTTKDTGSGVGLSLVKQIVLLHQGDISFQTDTTNGGTQFSVTI